MDGTIEYRDTGAGGGGSDPLETIAASLKRIADTLDILLELANAARDDHRPEPRLWRK